MTQTTAQLEISQAGFEAFLRGRDEPDWLVELRRSAWRAFLDQPWPSRTGEQWKRTDIRLFKLDRYRLPGQCRKGLAAPRGRLRAGVTLGGSCVALDGRPVETHLEAAWAEQGVLLGSLEELVRKHARLLQPYLLQRAVCPSEDKFAALHAACWTGGTLLYVPRGVAVDQPLHALSAMGDGSSDFGLTLVILEEGAQATMLSETASPNEAAGGFHCGAVELIVKPGAHLRYVDLQDWGQGVWHFAHQKAIVGRGASLEWTIGALGAKLAKVNQQVALVGQGASLQVNGVMFTEGKQHLSYHTLQHHQAPACTSDLRYKAALQDNSRTVWRGMIKVDPGAQKTDGFQRNDNLLLSPRARADSIPGLEIEADDVRCTHGSTTGRVDDELVFYCQCRGLSRQEAIRTVVTGFFQQIFDRITMAGVRQALGRAIIRRVRQYQ